MRLVLSLCVSLVVAACTCGDASAPVPPQASTERPSACCGAHDPSTSTSSTPTVPSAPVAEASAPRTFGASIDESIPITPLGAIIASPGEHAERVVRTRGTVHRVCQRMGCWMELRDGEGPPVRVPMAGHAFLLPRDCQGQPAEVQGRVVMQELSPEMRAHLGGEGATVLASTLSIDATGVRLGR